MTLTEGGEKLLRALQEKLGKHKIIDNRNNVHFTPTAALEEAINSYEEGRTDMPLQLSGQEISQVLTTFSFNTKMALIENKRKLTPDDETFFNLANMLSEVKNATYEELMVYAANVPKNVVRFFTAETFLLFPRDDRGTISVEDFLR
jgi:hypothetical protein